VARSAPHPNAAQLFRDFVLSADGQKLFESMGRTPAKVTSQSNSFRFTLIDPATVLDESARWDGIWNDLFIQR
jgi:ABC-type Fe3+ transport system substrate-binding protein